MFVFRVQYSYVCVQGSGSRFLCSRFRNDVFYVQGLGSMCLCSWLRNVCLFVSRIHVFVFRVQD